MTEKVLSSQGLWERVANSYYWLTELETDAYQDHINTPHLLSLLPNLPHQKLLDIGCGAGKFSRKVKEAHPDWAVVGLDGSVTLVTLAQRRNDGNAYFVQNVTEQFPFSDRFFDIAVCKMLFPSLENTQPVLYEAARVVKPGGKVIISTLNEEYVASFLTHAFLDYRDYYCRNLMVAMHSNPFITQQDIDREMERYTNELGQYPNAIWTTVGKSNFKVPVFTHSFDEAVQQAAQAGLHLEYALDLLGTEVFVKQNWERWGVKSTMRVLTNMVFTK